MSSPESSPRVIADAALLRSVGRLARMTGAGASATDLAEAIAAEIITLFDAHASAVFRFDGDEIVVVGGGTAPGWRIFTRGARFHVERQMLAAEIVETGRPARHAAYDSDPSDAARRITELGYNVVIGAPVHLDGELWGVIYAGAQGIDRLPEGSQDQLSVLADLCAMAVASAEQRARMESQAAEQSAVIRLARAVIEGAPEETVLTGVAREVTSLLDAPAAALMRAVEGGRFEVASSWPPDTDVDYELAALVAAERRLLQVGDPDPTALEASPRVLGRPLGWGAPIEIGGELWGVLVVAGEKGVPLPPDATERVARFAELGGVAITHVEAGRALVAQLVETERLATLVELSDDFIAIANLDGTTAYVNEGGRRLLGLESLEEAREKRIADYLTEEGRRHYEEVSGPTTRETGRFRGETTLRHFRTGEEIPVSVTAFMIAHPLTGEPIATAVVQHDLRARRRAEEQLRLRADEVETLAAARRFLLVEVLRGEERMRRQIADALHDDVLQELYAARLELDRTGDDPEASNRARAAIDAAVRRLRDAVGDLHPAAASTHGLEARLRSVLEQGGERAGFGYRLTFEAHGSSEVDELVLALLREFVHNTVKHADATFVVADVREDDGTLVLEVSDDGRGMSAERPAEALRTGHIGLASARERVDAVGGRFELRTAPTEGTRIRVSLPRESRETLQLS